MAARGYEFYLLVLKVSLTRSLRSLVRDTILSTLEHKIRISARPCNVFYLLHRRTLIFRMAEVRMFLIKRLEINSSPTRKMATRTTNLI